MSGHHSIRSYPKADKCMHIRRATPGPDVTTMCQRHNVEETEASLHWEEPPAHQAAMHSIVPACHTACILRNLGWQGTGGQGVAGHSNEGSA